MKRHLIAALAGVLLPSAAWAQPAFDSGFSGMKIGATIDYRWLKGDFRIPLLAEGLDERKGGVGYRGHLAFDSQFGGSLVAGVEAGLGKGGEDLTLRNATGAYTLEPGWSWDASGRLGVLAAPNMLLYGRAGYSWLRTRETVELDSGARDQRRRDTERGFLYGAGLETMISRELFLRAEYNRINYGDGLSASKALVGVSFGF